MEIQCLTTVVVEQFSPEAADKRLLCLLAWIGRRFGQVSSRGYRLSLKDMNLTHKALADLCGLTRVTVKKMLNSSRSDWVLQQVSKDDLLIPCSALSAVTA